MRFSCTYQLKSLSGNASTFRFGLFGFGLILVILLSGPIDLKSESFTLSGIGSKASGMGTAFIGLADDFSALFFNPAGLTQLKHSQISFYGTAILPRHRFWLGENDTGFADAKSIQPFHCAAAIAYLNRVSEKFIIGVSTYVPSSTRIKWDGNDLAPLSGGESFAWDVSLDRLTFSPVFSIRISTRLSLGFSINLNYLRMDRLHPLADGDGSAHFQYFENMSGLAIGGTMGALYRFDDRLRLGVMVKLPFSTSLNGFATAAGIGQAGETVQSDGERTITWPMVAGIGIAVRPNDRLIVTADLVYTGWHVLEHIPVTYRDPTWVPLAALSELPLKWEDRLDLKIGFEFRLSSVLSLRGGFYTERSAAPEHQLNILLPTVSCKALTFGVGFEQGDLGIDFAVEIIDGNKRQHGVTDKRHSPAMAGRLNVNRVVPNITLKIGL